MTADVGSRVIAAGGCLILAPGLLSAAVSTHKAAAPVSIGLSRLLGFAEQLDIADADELSVESFVARILLPAADATCAAHLSYLSDFPVTAHHPDQSKKAAKVMRADPAFQQIDMHNATLGNPSELDLTFDESIALQQTLNDHFTDDGIRFECKDPQRWYCNFDVIPRVRCTPVSAAIGRDVASCRPGGEDARQWRSKLAEIEMLLFEHPVNIARQQSNKLPVNTLWLWGEGSPVVTDSVNGVTVLSDNFYTHSVGNYTGVGCAELPSNSEDFKAATDSINGPILIVVDKFTCPVRSTDNPDDSLQWFDKVICESLWQNLKATAMSATGLSATGLPAIAIWCGDNRLFHVSASVKRQYLRRLFYKPQPLSNFLADDALPAEMSVQLSPPSLRRQS